MKSRTHWVGALLAVMIAVHPYLLEFYKLKLSPDEYALAGAAIYGIIAWLRWITTDSLDEK